MTEAVPLKNLPCLMGAMRQEAVSGELILEHNDGVRTLFISRGELIHLKSDAAGEQFGNYLLRQGILDLASLNELLANDERYRIGEKVIQWGMMSLEERDSHLRSLQEQIMIHALEHPVLAWTWNAGPMEKRLEQDLHFKLEHRHFIWNTFQESHYLMDLLTILEQKQDWRWEGRKDLVESLSDLPLTPGTAYALSFLGADPISFETFRSLSNLEEEAAGRFIVTLWALGALVLSSGKLPSVLAGASGEAPDPEPVPSFPAAPPSPPKGPPSFPLIFPPGGGHARTHVPPPLDIPIQLDPAAPDPEFLDMDPDPGPSRPAAQDPYGLNEPEEPPRSPAPPLPPAPAPRGDPFARPDPFAAQAPAFQQPSPFQPQAPPFQPQASPFDQQIPTYKPPPPPAQPLEGPARARSLVRKARQQVLMDRTVEAIRTLEQAVQLEPDLDVAYDAWLMLGQLRLANPAWSTRSIDALQTASKLRPRAAAPWASMGELYHRKGFEANAAACYRKALDLDPSTSVPPDVDLDAREPEPAPPPQPKGFFGRFRSILGKPEKS